MSIATIFFLLLGFFGLLYAFIILSYTIGWFGLKAFKPENHKKPSFKASIIVPARNEAENISFLLSDLCNQSVSVDFYEIIVVDDHSTDLTASLVKQFIAEHPQHNIVLLSITNEAQTFTYKKNAITAAVKKASGSLIITTDADCRLKPYWLETIMKFYHQKKSKMIVGPVTFHNTVSLFERLQTTEFLSLIAITAGAIGIRRPIMCNGANLAYEKSAFEEVGGFGTDSFASGDDVFLLLKLAKRFGNDSVEFLKCREAMVFTEAKKTLRGFIHQRIRWASKNKGYGFNILWVSFTVYMINLIILSGILLSPFYSELIPVIITAIIIKILVDLPILAGFITFAKQSKMFIYSIPLIFLYPAYIILTGAMGILVNYRWKGRKIKN
jgi:cellulose synthase/poly-beta-1,6-N-acetylglucosamine synthase-like glycosyltransferase